MQAIYYGYRFRSVTDGAEYRFDFRDLVSRFARWDDHAFKREMQYHGDTLYLLPFVHPVYLFVQTRDQELIKRIDKSDLSAEDVRQFLDRDESIGFASYVLLGDCWYAIASQVLSPRNAAFVRFVDMLMERSQIRYQFVSAPLLRQLAAQEVHTLGRVGRVSLKMRSESPLYAALRDYLTGGDGTRFEDVDSIEVILKTHRRGGGNLVPVASRIANSLPQHELEEFDLRGKAHLNDVVTDFYVLGAGGIRDRIANEDERQIPALMADTADANEVLQAKIREFRNDVTVAVIQDLGAPHLPW